MAPVVVLLKTVFSSILEVFLLCFAGFCLSYRGILDKRTQKQLNRLNVSLFTPALLFSKVAFFLTPAKLRELWVIPIFFTIVTVVSMFVAYGLGWMCRLKPSQRSFAIAAAMFMNSNSLPIALMQSLVVSVKGLSWDDDDTESAMLGRALTYLVLYSTLGMVLRWSYGVHLLSKADPETLPGGGGTEEHDGEGVDETSPLLGSEDTAVGATGSQKHRVYSYDAPSTLRDRPPTMFLTDTDAESGADTGDASAATLVPGVHCNCPPLPGPPQGHPTLTLHPNPQLHYTHHHHDPDHQVFYSFPNTPTRSRVKLVDGSDESVYPHDSSGSSTCSSSSEDEDEGLPPVALAARGHPATPHVSRTRTFFRYVKHRGKHFLYTLNEFMTMPLWAALASLVVALIQPLQHVLNQHLKPIKGALSAAGDCSIPLTLVVLGAYFYVPKEEGKEGEANGKANGSAIRVNGTDIENSNGLASTQKRGSWSGSISSAFSLATLRACFGSPANGKRVACKKQNNNGARPGETKTVVIAVASRMLLTPMLLLPLMALSARYDIPQVFDDPIFVVSNVLLISSPPALTLAQITQAASGDAFERLISSTIFWSYCVVTPPATIVYVVIGLLFAKL